MLLPLPARRSFLKDAGLGFGSLALASMLNQDANANPLAQKQPHFAAKAKSVIWLFMTGGPSQVDTWDYKPELQKRDGQDLAGADPKTGFFTTSGKCLKSPFEWRQHGESATWVPDLFPYLSQHVDEMTFIHSMYLRQNNHAPAAIELMCGTNRPGLPAMGAWMTYGLGSMNQNLPGYVVMTDGGEVLGGARNWGTGYMPATYQGTLFRPGNSPILNLKSEIDGDRQRAKLELIQQLNEKFKAKLRT